MHIIKRRVNIDGRQFNKIILFFWLSLTENLLAMHDIDIITIKKLFMLDNSQAKGNDDRIS